MIIELMLNLNPPSKILIETFILSHVEEMPEPIGGMYAIQSKIKYPEIAKQAGIQGKVYY